MTKQREGRGSKRCILTSTFRSRYNQEKGMGFSPENRELDNSRYNN